MLLGTNTGNHWWVGGRRNPTPTNADCRLWGVNKLMGIRSIPYSTLHNTTAKTALYSRYQLLWYTAGALRSFLAADGEDG